MKVGFTGTQLGMTSKQKATLENLLSRIYIEEFHHGDCIGADAQAHEIVKKLNAPIHIHPPKSSFKRAFCNSEQYPCKEYPPKEYLERNQDIVNATNYLFAAPKGVDEQLRSGTWSTVRKARKRKLGDMTICIVYPDGMYVYY